jgi:uncharacterized membrane protein
MMTDFTRYKLNHHFVYQKFYHSMLCARCLKLFWLWCAMQKVPDGMSSEVPCAALAGVWL